VSGSGGNTARSGQPRNTGVRSGQLVAAQTVTTDVTPAASLNINSKLRCFKCKQPCHTRRFCPLNSQSAGKHVNVCGVPVVSPDTQECLLSASYESYSDFVTL